jgi:hypothetical protein
VKTLYTVIAVMKLGAGLALLCCPSATAALLIGAPLETPAALTVGRVGGAGLLALVSPAGLRAVTRKAVPLGVGQRDGAIQSRRGCHPRRCGYPVAAGRRRLVAGGYSSRNDDRLVHRAPTEKTGADRRKPEVNRKEKSP